jgi:TATA element modulatory factor
MSYYLRTMTPSAFESALRQKDGELASYMSRLVCISILLIFLLKRFN